MSLNYYRSNIERITKNKANLEKDLARERQIMVNIQNLILSIKNSINNNTNLNTLQSKRRQISAKQKELAQHQKKAADLEGKISIKLEELNRNLKILKNAERQEIKQREYENKKHREEQMRHAQAMTRETERQIYLQKQIKSSRFIIDLARLPENIKVVFIASNPIDTTKLRLDEEIRIIMDKIRASEHRDSVQLVSFWAVRTGDFLQALNEHKPHILHFSGHGSKNDELLFHADDGSTKFVSKEAIVTTMSTISDNIRVVIFNSCFSHAQAKAVTQHVDVAIGMRDSISDEAAKVFAAQFYSAIGFGRSVQQAFEQGIVALHLEGIPETDIPNIFVREGIEAENIFLVRPETYFSEL